MGLKKVHDGFEFVDIIAPLFGKPEVFEKTGGGFEEKHDLGARTDSECAKVLEGGEFVWMLRFFKGLQRVCVWDHKRKGNPLMKFNLGIKETDGFGFGQTKAVEDFHSLSFQTSVDTSIDTV